MVLALLSGVAMFLYGMLLMGDGLKMVAGDKLETFLYKMTNTPLKGVALGAGVTCVIQSSSATTVMVIGFVNSMMMKLRQAISIIMGANIGTSITGWILCLSYIEGSGGWATLLSTATISAIVAVVGIVLRMFGKRFVYRNMGNIMLGFAILMMGMQTMSGAVEPLRENEFFVSMLTMFSNPLMGILVGIAFTAVLQSASAAVGVLQALSVTGILTFASAFPIVLVIGVGAACPVLISSIGANKNGKRTALIYLLNDLFGMIFWGIVFYAANGFLHFGFMDRIMTPVSVAFINTIFRVATVCVLFPFIPKLEKLVCMLVKDSKEEMEEEADLELLEEPAENLHAYSPAPGDPGVRKVIAESLNRRFGESFTAENIFMTCGAAASLSICMKALLNPGDEAVTFAPFFTEYRCWVEATGASLQVVPPRLPDFQIDTAVFESMLTPKTKLVIVNTPNNPSGVVYSEETIKALSDILRRKSEEYGSPIYLITDEPYREIVYDDIQVPYLTKYYENTLVCYSYSKSLSLPGERIGYIVIPDRIGQYPDLPLARSFDLI